MFYFVSNYKNWENVYVILKTKRNYKLEEVKIEFLPQ
jgi:hypothetical protein